MKERIGFLFLQIGFSLVPEPLGIAFSKVMEGFHQACQQAEVMQCDQTVTLCLTAVPPGYTPLQEEEILDDYGNPEGNAPG